MNALEILPQPPNTARWRKLWFPLSTPPFHFRASVLPSGCSCLDCWCPSFFADLSQAFSVTSVSLHFILSTIPVNCPLNESLSNWYSEKSKEEPGRIFKELVFKSERSVSLFNKYSLIACMSQGLSWVLGIQH